jgi:putative endonuclease
MNGTLYVGVTNDLGRRVSEHRNGGGSNFSKKHDVHKLVYATAFDDVNEAIAQEKRLKKWRRSWKIQLIQNSNPDWNDLLPY